MCGSVLSHNMRWPWKRCWFVLFILESGRCTDVFVACLPDFIKRNPICASSPPRVSKEPSESEHAFGTAVRMAFLREEEGARTKKDGVREDHEVQDEEDISKKPLDTREQCRSCSLAVFLAKRPNLYMRSNQGRERLLVKTSQNNDPCTTLSSVYEKHCRQLFFLTHEPSWSPPRITWIFFDPSHNYFRKSVL